MSIEYKKDKFGHVDWQVFLETYLREYIVLFKEKEEEIERKYSLPFYDVQKGYQSGQIEVDDKFKLVLLTGWKKLAEIRGYSSVYYSDRDSSYHFAAVTCNICWLDNEETEEKAKSVASCACAHFDNTYDFTQRYLTEMAENRSFARAVRFSLGINILGKDEISDKNDKPLPKPEVKNEISDDHSPTNTASGPGKTLQNKAEKVGFASFGEFKQFLRDNFKSSKDKKDSIIGDKEEKLEMWKGFNSYEDVKPKAEVLRIVSRLNKYLKAQEEGS